MYVLTVWLEIIPLRDCILPPFTSKVTRTAFYYLTGVEPRLGRRASFSVLFREGKPLYQQYREGRGSGECSRGGGVLTAKEGERLRARYSLLVEKAPLPPPSSVVFQFGAAEMVAKVEQVEVVDVHELRINVTRKFSVRFVTPTLLPVPGRGPLLKAMGVRRRYKLLPDLALALGLLSHDLRMQGVRVVERGFGEIYKWGWRALCEIDYDVRPVTVLYTVKEGIPSVERGFTGYVAYELLDPNSMMAEDLRRLLAFAERFGLGKSRSVGFGHVEISPLQ
ncbi:MAG: CRISPR system precrRNA processing endoribonuclease RAMP protein Cas6 [Thermofilum sp.]